MNIELTNTLKPASAVARRASEPSSVAAAPPARESGSVGETLSVGLLPLFEEIRQLPEIDASRVAEIKARIERGDYPLDSSRIARKMLEQESVFGAAG